MPDLMIPEGVRVLPVALGLLIVAIALAVRVVKDGRVKVVERRGRFHRHLDAGVHLIVPGVDRVRATVDLGVQVVTVEPRALRAADGRDVVVAGAASCHVTDPRAAVYRTGDHRRAFEDLTLRTFADVIASLPADEVRASRDAINARLLADLTEGSSGWGLRVAGVDHRTLDHLPPG